MLCALEPARGPATRTGSSRRTRHSRRAVARGGRRRCAETDSASGTAASLAHSGCDGTRTSMGARLVLERVRLHRAVPVRRNPRPRVHGLVPPERVAHGQCGWACAGDCARREPSSRGAAVPPDAAGTRRCPIRCLYEGWKARPRMGRPSGSRARRHSPRRRARVMAELSTTDRARARARTAANGFTGRRVGVVSGRQRQAVASPSSCVAARTARVREEFHHRRLAARCEHARGQQPVAMSALDETGTRSIFCRARCAENPPAPFERQCVANPQSYGAARPRCNRVGRQKRGTRWLRPCAPWA